jgi:hypothetical protein
VTPQTNLMVWAPITRGREAELRTLLDGMNKHPGVVDPSNAILPFARFDGLHFARFVILDDQTVGDIHVYGREPDPYPLTLAFLADFDGPSNPFLEELVRVAGPGLQQVFACCGYTPGEDLASWLRQHSVEPSASYVNWVGRTMLQVREERALRDHLCTWLRGPGKKAVAGLPAAKVRRKLQEVAKQSGLPLTPSPPAPIGWRISRLLSAVGGAILAIALLILLLTILLPLTILYVIILRIHETRDPEIDERATTQWIGELAKIEDSDVTNQFSAMGTLKPGWFRRFTITIGLAVVSWTARHLFTRGHLGRVQTIHFARWVFIDGGKRLYFASNYDGSLDSYMDDFINKVGFGLNLVFSNGIGYPRTKLLIFDGAKDEQKFKRYIRRHQLPTAVWYNAHPGLTAVDLARNARIREGLERPSMSEAETRQWLQLF